jgi:hypothetical protein
MIYNQLKKYKKKSLEEKPHLKKKRVLSGFAEVTGRPVGSIGFGWVFALACLLSYPDRSSTGSTRRAGPGLITRVKTLPPSYYEQLEPLLIALVHEIGN